MEPWTPSYHQMVDLLNSAFQDFQEHIRDMWDAIKAILDGPKKKAPFPPPLLTLAIQKPQVLPVVIWTGHCRDPTWID